VLTLLESIEHGSRRIIKLFGSTVLAIYPNSCECQENNKPEHFDFFNTGKLSEALIFLKSKTSSELNKEATEYREQISSSPFYQANTENCIEIHTVIQSSRNMT